MLRPVFRSRFSQGARSTRIDPAPGTSRDPIPGISDHAFNAPTLHAIRFSGHFGLVLAPRFSQEFRADKPSIRASTGRRSGHSGTLVGATGGDPKHTRAEQSEARTLRCARQGVVRVPESNTKYGGKRGITGAHAAPVIGPSIGESNRIRKLKKYPQATRPRIPSPLHRARFSGGPPLALDRLM